MLWLIGILIFFILLIVGLSVLKRPKKEKYTELYIKGLEAIADGKTDEAIDKLRDVIDKEPSNTGAYLYLGDLMREKGEISKAMMIHKNLSVNPSLSDEEKKKVKETLAKDYFETKEFKKAVSLYESLYKREPKNRKLSMVLLNLYEKLNDWDKAYNIARKIYTRGKDLANYATFMASHLINEDPKKAERYLSIGQKEDISYAHYLYGKLLISEGKEKSGIEYLKKSISLEPDRASAYLPELFEYMFKSGEFSVLEPYLKSLFEENSDNWNILNSYVSMLKKKGEVGKAEKILDESVHGFDLKNPCILSSIALAYNGINTDKAFEYLSAMQKIFQQNEVFECTECKNEVKEFSWKCPYCSSFGSLYPVRY